MKGVDWSNLFVAGGSVLACLLEKPELQYSEREDPRIIGHPAFQSSDVDIFLYGLDKEGGLKKIQHIYETIL